MHNNPQSPPSSRKKTHQCQSPKPGNVLDGLGAEQVSGLGEQLLRSCIDSAGDAIYILDAETGRIRDCTARACHDLGYSREELLGLSAKDIESSLTFEEVATAHRDLNVGEVRTVKGMHKRKDRTTFPVEIRLSSLAPSQSKLIISIVRDITERKQAEAAMRESEYFFRESQRSAFIGSYKTDFIRDAWLSSEVLDQIFGIDRDYGKTIQGWIDIVHPDDQDMMTRYLQEKVIAAHNPFDKEYRIVRKNDGETRWVYGRGKLDFDGQGKLLSMIGTIQDITERKRAENAVRESEERFRLIADSIDEVFWMADVVEERILYISPAYERVWGQSRQELYENRNAFRKTLHPEDFDRTIETLKIQKTGQAYDHEYRIIRPDGSVRQIWDRGFPVEDGRGCVRLYVGVAQDITNWRNAEKKHKEAEDYLHKIINCIADPIFVKDRQHRFLLINDAVCATLGKCAEEIIGSTSVEQLSGDVAHSLFEEEDRVFETGNADVSVNEIIGKNNQEFIFMSNKTLLTDVDGNKQIVVVLRDITDIKKAEKERSEIELQLRQVHKLEAIGRLAGGVAHDLNNMLGVIIGNTEMALSETHPTEPMYEELTEIHKAAERSANLTRQLLAFARMQTAAPKVLDLNKIISGMANMLKSLIGENISFDWRPAENLWQVKMDPSQMDQILTNLCTNARDAISNTGKITIETGNCTPNEDFCAAHPWFVPGEYVQLAVSDDGCGMDKETLAQIFEPFFTTKGIGKGTGLGLSTIYGIVKQNNCFIDVNSDPGKGTTCTIYLPRYADETKQAPKDGAASPTQGGHEIILLVEDEPAILQMATRALETKGYKVLAASTPSAAIRIAKEHSGEISLLLTDVVMPEMSGQELAKYLLSLYPQLRRLFMSGYTADVIAHQGVLDEGMHFIQKPFSMQDLAIKVREVLEAV